MKPELILGLTLFWGGFCLCPNPVWAEDRIWLEGKINGQPVRLAFDTGAGGPVLFKQSAERLGLKFTPPSKETPTVPNEVRIGNTEYCEFTLAGDTHKMWFAVVDIPDYVYFAGQMDGVLGWGDSYWTSTFFVREKTFWRPQDNQVPFDVARHRRRVHAAFADGHVETIPLQTLFSATTDEVLSLWNRDHQPHRDRLGE